MYRPEVAAGVADADCTGTAALVTGATSGVGRHVALALGRLGARVFVHGRDADRGRDVVDAVAASGGEATFLRADFTDLDAVRALAADVRERTDALDLLVNNAGAAFDDPRLIDGVERTFLVNHLAPFTLTRRLRDALEPDARVVVTASGAHRRADPAWDASLSAEGYDSFGAYSRSKLANVCFTRSLADRLDGPTANCYHPGFVPGSALWRNTALPVRLLMRGLSVLPDAVVRRVVDTPASGAATGLYCCLSDDLADVTGAYVSGRDVTAPSAAARDAGAAARLWELSEELTGEEW